MTKNRLTLTLAATGCVALGAGGSAILSAGAAGTHAHKGTAAGKQHHAKGGAAARLVRRAVHADLTVPTKDGFKQVTLDRGLLTAVAGDHLTISESTKKLTGKTVTVTVPAGARVRVDGQAATLTDLKAGQHVGVLVAPKRTIVQARTARK